MSLFGGFFGGFDDPFMGISRHMQQMNNMIESLDMMGGYPGLQPMPFGFSGHNALMSNMNNLNNGFGIAMSGGDCHSYSHSSVMTMSSGPNGQPQIYQASQSTRTGPGGLKETKNAVCDSRTGTKRLAVGRHIGERGHVRERVQNVQSGVQEETEDYINLDEDEAEDFNREWTVKSRDLPSHGRHALTYRDRTGQERRPRALPAITAGARSRVRSSPVSRRLPALTYNSQEDEEVDVVSEKPKKRAREQVTIEEIVDDVEEEQPASKKSSKKASQKDC